jgi:hypothetical protein
MMHYTIQELSRRGLKVDQIYIGSSQEFVGQSWHGKLPQAMI